MLVEMHAADVLKRWRAGATQVELAKAFGRSQSYVSKLIRRLAREG